MLSQRDAEIGLLKSNLADLQAWLDELLQYEASEKIVINSGNLTAFMDLMRQFQKLMLPNGKRLVSTQGHSPWYKMVAKNLSMEINRYRWQLPRITSLLKTPLSIYSYPIRIGPLILFRLSLLTNDSVV